MSLPHPYLDLLRDREVRVLWGGLTLSALGSEIYAVGAIWLAVSVAGADGSYLAAAQAAAVLAMSLVGGAFVEAAPRRVVLIGCDLVRAAFSLLVVVAAFTTGLTLPVLITASVALAAFGALFAPTLQSALPRLLGDPQRLRATNGLFDASTRTARTAGPFVAAALIYVIPPVHLLSVNALSFLASAAAIALVGARLEASPGPSPAGGVWARLLRGVRAANALPGAWSVLLVTTLRSGVFALGFMVGVPLFFAERASAGPLAGVAAVGLVMGANTAGELVSNLYAATARPRRPWRFLFAGYLMIGAGLALTGAAQAMADPALLVAAMVPVALMIGWGGGAAGIQMMSFFGGRLAADDFAGVLRLRLALVTGSAMVATAAGPWLFDQIGTGGVAGFGGVLLVAAAALGMSRPPR